MCIRDRVESESAIISNTIFFAITILPFLKEYGSNIKNCTRVSAYCAEFHKNMSVF